MVSRYEREAYQFLAVYRFLAYGLAVMFTQVTPALSETPLSEPPLPVWQLVTILSVLGVYTILKTFAPVRWRGRSRTPYVILGGDFILCILLLVVTGGLNSAFLLYSLAPIMTASLFFAERIALALAALASLALSIIHVSQSGAGDSFAQVMQGQNLTLLIIYTLFCFVGATVPYRINLNIRRRIERDAILQERRRIARELHDGVAQSIGYINMKTQQVRDSLSSQHTDRALTELSDIQGVVKETYEDVREAIDELGAEVRNVRIIPALTAYAQEFGSSNGIKVDLALPRDFPEISPEAELQLFRIAQEALTNIRRHADATDVTVSLKETGRVVLMNVTDNGKGFAIDDPTTPFPGHHGLDIIKERAAELGGSV
ncbi:MAG: sensor histidine kinase, partial [Dehalococcoidales bacterium]